MKLPEHERQAHREAFKRMSLAQKAEYIFAYYKLPLILTLIAVVFAGSVTHRLLTEKEAVLYVAYANVAVPDELDRQLTSEFLDAEGISPTRSEVYCYRDLYLTAEATTATHQYAYASKLKTLASVDAEELDIVLMNREAYDLLSRSGYLLDLKTGLHDTGLSLPPELEALAVANEVVLEDNQIEVDLGEAETYEAVCETHTNALDVSTLAPFTAAHLDGTVYLGIIANTPRLERALAYFTYLARA